MSLTRPHITNIRNILFQMVDVADFYPETISVQDLVLLHEVETTLRKASELLDRVEALQSH